MLLCAINFPPRVLGDQVGNNGWQVDLQENGSGIDPSSLLYEVDGNAQNGYLSGKTFYGEIPSGARDLNLVVQDKAGNLTHYAASCEQLGNRPMGFALGVNFPNPFNPETIIPVALNGKTARIRLGIYNLAGQLIRQLLDEKRPAGNYEILWDGRDKYGYYVGSGVYLYCVETPAGVQTRRMTLMK